MTAPIQIHDLSLNLYERLGLALERKEVIDFLGAKLVVTRVSIGPDETKGCHLGRAELKQVIEIPEPELESDWELLQRVGVVAPGPAYWTAFTLYGADLDTIAEQFGLIRKGLRSIKP